MASTRHSLVFGAVTAVVVAFAVITALVLIHGTGGRAQPIATKPSAVVPVSPPSSATSSTEVLQGSSATSATPEQSAPTLQELASASFSISMGNPKPSETQCPMPVVVKAKPAKPGETLHFDEPNKHDWCGTSAWLQNSSNQWVYPSAQRTGITYVGLHACHHHQCPFSFVQCTSHCSDRTAAHMTFTVARGEKITIVTPSSVLAYRVCGIGVAYGDLIGPSCGTLRLGNCGYDSQRSDDAAYDIVLSATLESTTPRT